MKFLLFMRHGEPDYRSEKRELTKNGVLQAQSVAEQIIKEGIKPDVIISSDLPRARHTAEVLAEQLRQSGHECAVSTDPRLREMEANPQQKPTPDSIRGVLDRLDDKIQTAAIVGHKDELAQAVYLLTGTSLSFHYADAVLVACYEDAWAQNAASSVNLYQRTYLPKSGR